MNSTEGTGHVRGTLPTTLLPVHAKMGARPTLEREGEQKTLTGSYIVEETRQVAGLNENCTLLSLAPCHINITNTYLCQKINKNGCVGLSVNCSVNAHKHVTSLHFC